MRPVYMVAALLLAVSSAAFAQVPDPGPGTIVSGTGRTTVAGTCPSGKVIPAGTPIPDDHINDAYAYLCGISSSSGTTSVNPGTQAAMNALSDASYELGYKLGQWLFSRGNNNPAAAAAAAEAEREREAEIARQKALEEQKRQEIFDRLSHELMGMTDVPQLQMMGVGNTPQLQMMGMDDAPQLQMMGTSGASATGAAPANADSPPSPGPQTCFFGECGPRDPGLQEEIEPWNDPKLVDLRDLQQGLDLADVATKAPPADRQAIMDQALDAANGDQSIQVNIPADNAVPVMSEQGLLAFQQANNAYRQAHNDAYQLQQNWQQDQQRDQAAYAITTQSEQQLEANLKENMDAMTLEQKQQAMAQIFDAALQQDLQYGKTWAEYLSARQNYYEDKYELQMYLWNTALGKQGSPPAPPKQLAESALAVAGPPDSDLSLVLPPVQPVVKPTKEDISFLQQLQGFDSARRPDSLTERVINYLQQEQMQEERQQTISDQMTERAIDSIEHQDEADALLRNLQQPQVLPPNLENQYRFNPQFRQQMDAEHQMLVAAQQQSEENAVEDIDQQWQQKLSQLQGQPGIQQGVPLAQQAQNNPQLAEQLATADKQVTANLVYKVMRIEYETQREWQKWIEQEEVTLPQPKISSVGAARD